MGESYNGIRALADFIRDVTKYQHASEVPAAPSTVEDEELMDYEASPERINMEINVVRFSDDYWAIPKEETAYLDFEPHKAIFQKP